MDMKEFYEKYNLSNECFASMAGVGKNSLKKYQQGLQLKEESKARIEKAMRVVEKHNYVRPKAYRPFYGYSTYFRVVDNYIKEFKKILKKEF